MAPKEIVTNLIHIQVSEHAATHLLVATSVDLKGLVVAANSIEQLEAELPGAIREVLEAKGIVVESIDDHMEDTSYDGFLRRSFLAHATLVAN